MKSLRVGTRGSQLALRQTQIVCDLLRNVAPAVHFETVVIKTYGDIATDQPIDRSFPAGGFVAAIEQALVAGEVDFAVHSCKDLPAEPVPDLTIAAIPKRADPSDLLISRRPVRLDALPSDFKIGSSSARRRAQMRHFAGIDVLPVRGNVPTRLDKMQRGDFDAVILAAAGLRRLDLTPPFVLPLPIDAFLPSPGQGALAVQARTGDDELIAFLACIEDSGDRRCVDAERAFLLHAGSGCHSPLAALATHQADRIRLQGQLFTEDDRAMAQGESIGQDPVELGASLARELSAKLANLRGT